MIGQILALLATAGFTIEAVFAGLEHDTVTSALYAVAAGAWAIVYQVGELRRKP